MNNKQSTILEMVELNENNVYDIIKSLNDSNKIKVGKGVNESDIKNAENKLGIKISKQLKSFYMKYGYLSYKSHDIFGLGIGGSFNVVTTTLNERKMKLPDKYIVIENIGVDGLLIVSDSNGTIFEWTSNGHEKKIYNNFEKYLFEILK
jgi:hypothetical protein